MFSERNYKFFLNLLRKKISSSDEEVNINKRRGFNFSKFFYNNIGFFRKKLFLSFVKNFKNKVKFFSNFLFSKYNFFFRKLTKFFVGKRISTVVLNYNFFFST